MKILIIYKVNLKNQNFYINYVKKRGLKFFIDIETYNIETLP